MSPDNRPGLLRPLVCVALIGLAVLTMAAAYVVDQFDAVAQKTQFHMVQQGYRNRIAETIRDIAPIMAADQVARHIVPAIDAPWIDRHLAHTLAQTMGADHLFILDAGNHVAYAAVAERRADAQSYRPFARSVADLLPQLRARATGDDPVSATNIAVKGETLYLVTATPIAHGPLAVTAVPFDQRMLMKFGARYMVGDLAITRAWSGQGILPLADARGTVLAALTWTPQRPASIVFSRLRLPLALAGAAFLLVAWSLMRQSSAIADTLIASEARARHLSLHDGLTGLPNRVLLFERLGQWQVMARRSPPETACYCAVHCLDLDRFKEVNDTMGHLAGDELIRAVATRIVALCADTETVARMGGDEFVILQPQTDASGASLLAERVLEAMRWPFDLSAGSVVVGCSIGIALICDAQAPAAEILRQADLALYQSKEQGRNRATFFEPEMDAALRQRRKLEVDLRHALSAGELHMVYQPQVDQDRKVVGMEALVRWNHPGQGMISPALFVPLAEEAGLIGELGEYTFRRVFAETAQWRGTPVAVNVSALQLQLPSFMAVVTRLVAEYGIDPAQYQIEITETVLLGDDGATRDNIAVLSQEGFSIALDDFGTGYSSLSSLQRFAIDKIKIDRSFVRYLDAPSDSAHAGKLADHRKLVDAIIKLGKALKLEVIAEGVETEAQRDQLILAGCTRFQGYLFGRPVPATYVAGPVIGVGEPVIEDHGPGINGPFRDKTVKEKPVRAKPVKAAASRPRS